MDATPLTREAPGIADASAWLVGRFPDLSAEAEFAGRPELVFCHLVSRAEAVSEQAGRRFLPDPDTVAANVVNQCARLEAEGRRVLLPDPGSGECSEFALLVTKVAHALEKRAGGRAASRREIPSSDTLSWSRARMDVVDPEEAVIVKLSIARAITNLHKVITAPAQRAFLEAVLKRPDLIDSLGAHGEGSFVAAEVGVSPVCARQLLKRIRAAAAACDPLEAA